MTRFVSPTRRSSENKSRDHVQIASLSVMIVIVWGTNSWAQLTKDHPIYQFPQSESTETPVPRLKHLRVFGRPDFQPPKWSFRLKKDQVRTGEILWGEIAVTNPKNDWTVRFSPPYHGQYVSTISVWISRYENEKWTDLREIVWVNQGQYHQLHRSPYRGVAVVLKPGEEFRVWIPLNVTQQPIPIRFKKSFSYVRGWYAGKGMQKPGRYRVYIRYFNLRPLTKFTSTAKPRDLPCEPVVLGPKEFVVQAIESKTEKQRAAATKLDETLTYWNNKYRKPFSCEIKSTDMTFVPSIIEAFSNHRELRRTLLYSMYREGKSIASLLPSQENDKRSIIERLISEIPKSDPLWEHAQVSACALFYRRGEIDRALKLARKINTPDAVLLAMKIKERQAAKANSDKEPK